MKKCIWDEYICLLEKEIEELVEHEVHCHLSAKGESVLHNMIENYKHVKEMMAKDGGMLESDGSHKSYFGG